LKNLQTDYLDVFLLHRPSPLMQADEIAEAVDPIEKRRENFRFWCLEFYADANRFDSVKKRKSTYNQIQFSATHLQAMLDGSLDYMQFHKIRPMAWNPLGTSF
jgi:predicted oxidoreductase